MLVAVTKEKGKGGEKKGKGKKFGSEIKIGGTGSKGRIYGEERVSVQEREGKK